MLTAIYYLKARFADAQAAGQALPLLRAFVAEGVQAHTWWKTHRDLEAKGQRTIFWRMFKSQFPIVHRYLGERTGGSCDDALCPFLQFGTPDRIELSADDRFVKYKAEVWHEADWEPLSAFLKAHFGAQGVDHIGDEPGFDVFTILDP